MEHSTPVGDQAERKSLVLLLTQHQRRIFAYIHALVPDRPDAEDILQQTNLVICDKFGEFRLGSDFAAWACQIAWWEVRRARQKFARSKVVFDEVLLETVSNTIMTMAPELDQRHEALATCLDRLPARDREMILTRYEPDAGVEEAARRAGRSLDATYKALGRIRRLLLDCVTHRLAVRA